jgi:SAM-dependent methyltransferase
MASPPPERPEGINRITSAVYPAFALLAAMQLDLFTPLQDGALTAEQLAEALNVGVAKLRPVLYILADVGMLTLDGDRFGNTSEGDYYLVRGRRAYMGGAHEILSDLWSAAFKTAASVRTGRAQAMHDYTVMSQDELGQVYRGLNTFAMAAGRALVRRYDFTAYRHLLDVGGGSGGLSVTILEANPHMQATIVDLPNVTPLTRGFIADTELTPRIKVQAGDVVQAPPPGEYDVAVMRAFIQVLGVDEARNALRHVGQALRPDGDIYIVGAMLDDSRLSPQSAVYSNLVFANIYDGGQAYTEAEHRAWLTEAGFENITRTVLSDGSSIITARKKA